VVRNEDNKQFTERFYGRCERRIPLGYEVKEDQVDARLKNGVLTVILPKAKRRSRRASASPSRTDLTGEAGDGLCRRRRRHLSLTREG